jgi:hypothetical protein
MKACTIAAVIIRIFGLIVVLQYLYAIISFAATRGQVPLPPLIPLAMPLLVVLMLAVFAKPIGKLVTFDFKD